MNAGALTVRTDDLEALLDSLWFLLWQAAQPLPHPGIRPGFVAQLYDQAILLTESAGSTGDLKSRRLWNLAQHHRHRLARWREELREIYEDYGEV